MKLVFATSNKNKIKEVQALMPQGIELLSLEEIGCHEEIPETSPTIEGNAIQKAEYIRKNYGHDCFADDTGLEVTALNGAPGVYSARYAGEAKSSDDNIDKLLWELKDKNDRSARFKTVIALHLDGKLHTFEGICTGNIIFERKGLQGFGYDPVFQPEGKLITFAEMSLEKKSEISHRARATRQLIDFLRDWNA